MFGGLGPARAPAAGPSYAYYDQKQRLLRRELLLYFFSESDCQIEAVDRFIVVYRLLGPDSTS